MTEDQLLAEVCRLMAERGLLSMHQTNVHHSARRGNLPGFPDLFICGPGGSVFRELKSMSAGKGVEGNQCTWKYALIAAGQDWAIWTPADLASGEIARQLDRLADPASIPAPTGDQKFARAMLGESRAG